MAETLTIGGASGLHHIVVRVSGADRRDPSVVHSGTGFFYDLVGSAGWYAPLIVSNKHVLMDREWLEFDMATAKSDGSRDYGAPCRVRLSAADLPPIPHPDPRIDLAAVPASVVMDAVEAQGRTPYHVRVDDSIRRMPAFEEGKFVTGSVLMVGFPNAIMDEVNNVPVMRRGMLATPYVIDYRGSPDFLLDIAAFGGSSGSPVFLHREAFLDNGVAGGSHYEEVSLIGVLYAGHYMDLSGQIGPAPVPTAPLSPDRPYSQMLNLGICVKASKLLDFDDLIRSHMPSPREAPR